MESTFLLKESPFANSVCVPVGECASLGSEGSTVMQRVLSRNGAMVVEATLSWLV